MVNIDGEVAAGYEPVREAFQANFERHGDLGAAFCLYRGGRKVVDLWGGVANAETGEAWDHDTVQLVFSTTKGATAICALRLVERGDLTLDSPVAEFWPEFKAEGKEQVPVRWLLSHRSGLPIIDRKMTPAEALDWPTVTAALAAQRPVWEPGTAHGYHALTYGWLVGEVVRRVDGRSLGQFFADEVAAPLGLDFWIGLPADQEPRVSRLTQAAPISIPEGVDVDSLPQEVREMAEVFLDPDSLSMRALSITDPPIDWNAPSTHRAEVPAANGICTARGLARMYAATIGEVGGVRVLAPATVTAATETQSEGRDRILLFPTRFGLGFMLNSAFSPLLGPRSFGHAGAGGSLGFADPDAGIGFGYVMNQMQQNLAGDPRTIGLITAVRECLA
jgi:CubicO group peptidase (beta-lactamase class C family)